jgi:hypothetical protein
MTGRLVAILSLSLLATVPATFGTVLTYLVIISGSSALDSAVPFALRATPISLGRAMPIAVLIGVIAAFAANCSRFRQVLILLPLITIGGAAFGALAAGGSPHISRELAALSGASSWLICAAILLVTIWLGRSRSGLTSCLHTTWSA